MAQARTVTVSVSSRPERFRRAGLEFTREAREVEVDEKTLAALEAEPMLAVARVEAKGASKGKDKTEEGGGGKGS